MRILITGGSGFIGTNLLEYYLIKGMCVLNVDFSEPRNKKHIPYWKNVDIRNSDLLESVILDFNPDFIFHLAARTDLDGKTLDDYNSNHIGTYNVLNVSKKCINLRRVIFTSSQLVCSGRMPSHNDDYFIINPYGESKKQGELIIKKDKNIQYEWLIVRPTSIWGPWFREPYRNFFDLIINRKYFHIGNKSCTKTYGFIGNTIFQLNSLMLAPKELVNNEIFYLADYNAYNIEEWANEIAAEIGIKINRMPMFIIYISAIIGDILKKINVKFPMTSYRLHNMTQGNVKKLDKISSIINNLPYSRIEGVKITLKWMTANK